MISMTWTDAPTGFSGSGGVAVRSAACRTVAGSWVDMVPPAAPVQGSGLPVAARLRPVDEPGAIHASYLRGLVGIAPISTSTEKNGTENNGTTLGIHPPGRPQS